MPTATAPIDMPTAIVTRGLARSYGKTHALHPTTLAIPAGAVVAFLGHNGAGKTSPAGLFGFGPGIDIALGTRKFA